MKVLRAHEHRFEELPTDYAGLVRLLPPRPIHDRHELRNVEEIVFAMAGHKLTPDQEDYLQLMSDLLLKYEQEREHETPECRSPAQRLQYLLEQSETTSRQLGELLEVSESSASMILKGRRELSTADIRRLARHFSIDPGYLL